MSAKKEIIFRCFAAFLLPRLHFFQKPAPTLLLTLTLELHTIRLRKNNLEDSRCGANWCRWFEIASSHLPGRFPSYQDETRTKKKAE